MKCEQYEHLFTDWISKEISCANEEALEQHLAGCPDCREELAIMQQVWTEMAEMPVPEPSANMQVKFDAMLNTFKAAEAEKVNGFPGIMERLGRLWKWQPQLSLAYTLVIILVSFGCGYLVFHEGKGAQQDKQLQALSSQVHELKQTMMLAMLENPSATERMKAVNYTSEIKHADQQVIDALFATLNNDPNVNVRLSTLDALTRLANHPEVREGLVKSITEQDSPLMQSAIADVMLKLQEKKSVRPLRELLKQKDLDHGVRDKIQQTIQSLI